MAGSDPRTQARKVFDRIVSTEVEAINRRRAENHRPLLSVGRGGGPDGDGHLAGSKTPVLEVTALALSGGGIRAASFSLGVLQALNEHKCFPRIDYLSTVSGGGYIGSAVTATMTKTKGKFVFGESTAEDTIGARPADVKDTQEVGHLRNYSNYLIPFGARDVITALAIVMRGLVANGAIVLGVALLLAALTVMPTPVRSGLLDPNIFGFLIANLPHLDWLDDNNFGIALLMILAGLPLFLCWAIWRSLQVTRLWRRGRHHREDQAEFRTWWPAIFAGYLLLFAVVAIIEFQPFVLAGMFDLLDKGNASATADNSMLTAFIKWLVAMVAPIGAVVTFFRQQIGTLFKSVTTSSRFTTKLLALGASIGVWIGGAALPLVLWVLYLHLSFWAISNDGPPGVTQGPPPQVTTSQSGDEASSPSEVGRCETPPCPQQQGGSEKRTPTVDPFGHAPPWLVVAANTVFESLGDRIRSLASSGSILDNVLDYIFGTAIASLYVFAGALLLLLSLLLRPNANSLHQLYRDRLSKAFLFDPTKDARDEKKSTENVVDRTFAPIGAMPISELAGDKPHAPYHLINATLNVQGSDYANRRGRNSDFFLFSPCFVGSEATHYAETHAMERATDLDLATAMAISGAAFSPNAGAASIRPLTPTLALLNVRTGYWLKNPRLLASDVPHADRRRQGGPWFYLWAELSGQLYETSDEVFISDGGHIENLGVYELLRRRCRVIVAVDAEADPSMRYPSFITLQRYARIDLGVRITMPWDDIRQKTCAWMGFTGDLASTAVGDKEAAANQSKPSAGPHVAIGTIEYDGGETGWLVYIKASLTGDENDYVRDYARRHEQFPHESTGDQFFSEEQFEVYRALGFHVANRLLNGTDVAQVYDDERGCMHLNIRAQHPNVDPVRRALFTQ